MTQAKKGQGFKRCAGCQVLLAVAVHHDEHELVVAPAAPPFTCRFCGAVNDADGQITHYAEAPPSPNEHDHKIVSAAQRLADQA